MSKVQLFGLPEYCSNGRFPPSLLWLFLHSWSVPHPSILSSGVPFLGDLCDFSSFLPLISSLSMLSQAFPLPWQTCWICFTFHTHNVQVTLLCLLHFTVRKFLASILVFPDFFSQSDPSAVRCQIWEPFLCWFAEKVGAISSLTHQVGLILLHLFDWVWCALVSSFQFSPHIPATYQSSFLVL